MPTIAKQSGSKISIPEIVKEALLNGDNKAIILNLISISEGLKPVKRILKRSVSHREPSILRLLREAPMEKLKFSPDLAT